MTLIVLEGISRSGKSTVRDNIIEENPEWVVWKGENLMRKGVGDSWNDYRERYHEALHRLYELNPHNVIIADRGFSDCVYNSDEQMRREYRRLAACYGDVYILYFYPGAMDDAAHDTNPRRTDGTSILRDRGSRDTPKMEQLKERYEKLLEMFTYKHIDTRQLDEAEATAEAVGTIQNWHENGEHNPDL